jgi:hypothetical protein
MQDSHVAVPLCAKASGVAYGCGGASQRGVTIENYGF